jgi:hypothetical protein
MLKWCIYNGIAVTISELMGLDLAN